MLRSGFTHRLVALAGLGLLAACSEQTMAPGTGGDVNTAGVKAGPEVGQHWMAGTHLVDNARVSLLIYHNGPVIKASKTQAIFWGTQWTSGVFPSDVVSGLDQLFSGWGGSRYNAINTEYGDGTGNITSASTYLGHVFDGSTPPTAALSTSQAVAEACKITNNAPDPAAIYVIYTPTFPSNVNYCAWHSWGNCSNGAPVQVAYEPNANGVAGCNPSDTWTTHSEMLASLANTTGHEVAEAETDPRGTGWYDRQGNENADKCAWTFSAPVVLANGATFKIQRNWSNAARGCVQGN